MTEANNPKERGLNQETLTRLNELSKQKEAGAKITVKAGQVGPFTDEITITNTAKGTTKTEYIEEA